MSSRKVIANFEFDYQDVSKILDFFWTIRTLTKGTKSNNFSIG